MPANTWLINAPPCIPYPNNISLQMSELGNYGQEWISFSWDKTEAAPGRYIRQTAADPMNPGNGYWHYTLNGGATGINMQFHGDPSKLQDICRQNTKNNTIPQFGILLAAPEAGHAWNLIANPFPYPLDWTSVTIALLDENFSKIAALTPSEAGNSGYIGSAYYTWNGNAYTGHNDTTPGIETVLSPQEGFWLTSSLPDNDADHPGVANIEVLFPDLQSTVNCSGAAEPMLPEFRQQQ